MAQAFEIPTGNRKTTRRCSPAGATLRVPRRAFQIAGRPEPINWIDRLAIWGQFWPAASARKSWSDATRGRPIPDTAILRKLINPVGFDKTKLPADSGFVVDRRDQPQRPVPQISNRSVPQAEITAVNSIGTSFSKISRRANPRKSPAATAGLFCFPGATVSGPLPG